MKKKQKNLSLSNEAIETLEGLSTVLELPMSEVVERAIREYAKLHNEALAEYWNYKRRLEKLKPGRKDND